MVPDPSPNNHLASLLKPRFLPFSRPCTHLLPVFRRSTWTYAPQKSCGNIPSWMRRSKPGFDNNHRYGLKVALKSPNVRCPSVSSSPTGVPEVGQPCLGHLSRAGCWGAGSAEPPFLHCPALPLGLLGSRGPCTAQVSVASGKTGLDGEDALFSGGLGFPGLRKNLSCQSR